MLKNVHKKIMEDLRKNINDNVTEIIKNLYFMSDKIDKNKIIIK
jgi:hypothetical protein